MILMIVLILLALMILLIVMILLIFMILGDSIIFHGVIWACFVDSNYSDCIVMFFHGIAEIYYLSRQDLSLLI